MLSRTEKFGFDSFTLRERCRWGAIMDRVATTLEREGDILEILLFKLVEVRLLLEADEARFLPRASREVERARTRAREVGLMRAATVAQERPGATLRGLANDAPSPWGAILRDHHALLSGRLAEIEVGAHQNATLARAGLAALAPAKVPAGAGVGSSHSRTVPGADLDRLARGAAYEAVLGTAARLHMPDLIDFLR
jgi:hypothetical protein